MKEQLRVKTDPWLVRDIHKVLYQQDELVELPSVWAPPKPFKPLYDAMNISYSLHGSIHQDQADVEVLEIRDEYFVALGTRPEGPGIEREYIGSLVVVAGLVQLEGFTPRWLGSVFQWQIHQQSYNEAEGCTSDFNPVAETEWKSYGTRKQMINLIERTKADNKYAISHIKQTGFDLKDYLKKPPSKERQASGNNAPQGLAELLRF